MDLEKKKLQFKKNDEIVFEYNVWINKGLIIWKLSKNFTEFF